MGKLIFEIAHYDQELDGAIDQLRSNFKKGSIETYKTNRGLIESDLRARAGINIQPVIEFAKFAAVFIISAFTAGFFGQAGANTYTTISENIKKFLKNRKIRKNLLLLIKIDRHENFPLMLGFVINHNDRDENILAALNSIPSVVNTVKKNIGEYKKKEVLIISFFNRNWDLPNAETRVMNHGLSSIAVQRVGKLYGAAEKKYMPPEKKDMTDWEYLNISIPESATQNALKHRTDYYQRVYTPEEIKCAIYNFHAVSIFLDIFKDFLNAPNGQIPMPENHEKCLGQHCVAAKGYSKEGIVFANSWGASWGNRGYGYLPWQYVEKYVYEAWASNIFAKITHIRFKNFWRLRFWVNYFKDKKKKKLIASGSFNDKRDFRFDYSLYSVPPINPTNGNFFVLNTSYNKSKRTPGWLHFSCKDDSMILEDLFIDPDNRNVGLGSSIIKTAEEIVARHGIKNVKGWVSIEDCYDEFSKNAVETFFKNNKYSISRDSTKFRGSFLRIEKILKVT